MTEAGSMSDGSPDSISPGLSTAQDEVVSLCRTLIRFDTSNPTSDESEAAQWVLGQLEEVGLTAELIESEPGRASVVCRVAGEDSTRGGLLLHRARQRRGQCGKQRRTVRKQRQLRAGRGLRRIGLQRRGQLVVAVGLRAIGGAGFVLGVHRLLHAVAVAAVLCQRGRAGAGQPGGKAGGGHGQAHRAQGGSQQRKERQRDLVVKPHSGLLTGPGRASL